MSAAGITKSSKRQKDLFKIQQETEGPLQNPAREREGLIQNPARETMSYSKSSKRERRTYSKSSKREVGRALGERAVCTFMYITRVYS